MRTALIALALTATACGDAHRWFELPAGSEALTPTCSYGEVLHGGVCVQDVRIDLLGVSLVSSYRAESDGHVVTPSAPFYTFVIFDVQVANLGGQAVGLRWGVYPIGAGQPSYVPTGEPSNTDVPSRVDSMTSYTGTVTAEVLDDGSIWDMGLLVEGDPAGGKVATRGWGLSRYRPQVVVPPSR